MGSLAVTDLDSYKKLPDCTAAHTFGIVGKVTRARTVTLSLALWVDALNIAVCTACSTISMSEPFIISN